jgi:hypothetical protein
MVVVVVAVVVVGVVVVVVVLVVVLLVVVVVLGVVVVVGVLVVPFTQNNHGSRLVWIRTVPEKKACCWCFEKIANFFLSSSLRSE